MARFLATVFKIAMMSLIVGVMLSAFEITANDLLAAVGMTPESLWQRIQEAAAWAIPNIILGALIVVPVWFVIYLFKPPAG